jgi:hypothetical protein
MIFWSCRGDDRAAAIEMKSKNPRPSKVQRQLQAGADLIDTVGESCSAISFAAVLTKTGMRSVGYQALRRKKVRFRGKPYPIRLENCPVVLSSLF